MPLRTFKFEFAANKIWFTNQSYRPMETKNRMNLNSKIFSWNICLSY